MATIDRDAIAAMYRVIRPHVRRTPVLEFERNCYLKLEFTQHTGSFKLRGAFANLLSREIPKAGVVAASGGNHGAAVAYAAMKLGVPCAIFVPVVSSPAKIARIEAYGARLHVGGDRYADAYAASVTFAERTGAMQVHAFDADETMLGAGTCGLEFDEQISLDTVLVAVGGGGLIAGVSAAFAGRARIIGVEPEGAPTMYDAFAAGHPVDAPAGSIASDSLAPRRIGERVFPVARANVERVVLVSDDAIAQARASAWDRARIVAEPGGATAFAALLSGAYVPETDERVGVVMSGANTVISW